MPLKKQFSGELKPLSPYNFKLTVSKPAGWWWSTPFEEFEENTLWTVARFDDTALGLKLLSVGTLKRPQIEFHVFASKKIGNEKKGQIINLLERSLLTKQDLSDFYSLAEDDQILKETAQRLCGMHTVSWPELFSALILAVTLQMSPMKRSNDMMNSIIDEFGQTFSFDGKRIRYWPSFEKIASTPVRDLERKANLGYRAKFIKKIAQSLNDDFPTMNELYMMEPEEARKKLMTLHGIGEYSAELVMPGMGFPLDIWSAKIFGILLNGEAPKNPREDIPELKSAAQKRWGKWAGYAFVYVLNDLENISKRIGKDLTSF
jgi:DNA-3-methyladenine glycosylase II